MKLTSGILALSYSIINSGKWRYDQQGYHRTVTAENIDSAWDYAQSDRAMLEKRDDYSDIRFMFAAGQGSVPCSTWLAVPSKELLYRWLNGYWMSTHVDEPEPVKQPKVWAIDVFGNTTIGPIKAFNCEADVPKGYVILGNAKP